MPQRILMIAWPRGKWRTPRWESVDMGAALRAAVHDASQSGVHVALVDKVEAEGSLPALHALPENVYANFPDETDLIQAIRDYVAGRLFEGQRDSRTTILCCTDSRRDACCARHGFSTYKALVGEADPAVFNIVQATHIGGCRFAASLMVMPQRQRYGRMTAEQASDFLAALSRDEIYLPAYKGRTGWSEPAQVAEIAAMQWANRNGHRPDAIMLEDVAVPGKVPDGTELLVKATVGSDELVVRLHARTFFMQGNCEIVAEGRGVDTLRWLLDEVTLRNAGA